MNATTIYESRCLARPKEAERQDPTKSVQHLDPALSLKRRQSHSLSPKRVALLEYKDTNPDSPGNLTPSAPASFRFFGKQPSTIHESTENSQCQQQPEIASAPKLTVTTRNRLDTAEDTVKVNNLHMPDLIIDQDNPFLECRRIGCEPSGDVPVIDTSNDEPNHAILCDGISAVSSLSEGTFKQLPPRLETPALQQHQSQEPNQQSQQQQQQIEPTQDAPFVPPREIAVPIPEGSIPVLEEDLVSETEVPEWLLPEDHDERKPKRTSNKSSTQENSSSDVVFSSRNLYRRDLPEDYGMTMEESKSSFRFDEEANQMAMHRGSVAAAADGAIAASTPRGSVVLTKSKNQRHIQTAFPSPAIARPTMGRHRSAPCSDTLFVSPTPVTPGTQQGVTSFPMDLAFPMSPAYSASSTAQYTRRSVVTYQGPSPQPLMISSNAPPRAPLTPQPGNMQRHHHQQPHIRPRNSCGNGSVASLVGQSTSSWTAPTAGSASLASHDQSSPTDSPNQHRRSRSAMRDELRYMWGKMSKPVKHILLPPVGNRASGNGKSDVELHRSTGCLT